MKKVISILMITVLFASLAACGGASEPTTDASQPLSPSEAANKSDSTPIIEVSPLLDEDELKLQFEQVADACADIINSFVIDIDKGMYPMPTLEEYAALSETIGAFGHPIDYYDLDMPNHEKVVAFANDVKSGKDAQVIIYRLFNWGIAADVLESRDDGCFYKWYVCDFPSYSTTEYKPEFVFDNYVDIIDDLQMTDTGLLFYHAPEQDGKSERYRGYRVMPLGEENREYNRKYVSGLGDAPGNILGETWDKDSFDDLSLVNVFDSLYYKVHEDFPSQYTVDYPNDGEAIRKVPADVMEGIMLNSLPLTLEKLRECIPYDESQKVYNYHIISRGSMGIYDVVKSVKNADGSLTLTIDVIPVYWDYNDVCTYSLTVMDNPDGSIKYISNVVIKR